jgi:hypothetical protein
VPLGSPRSRFDCLRTIPVEQCNPLLPLDDGRKLLSSARHREDCVSDNPLSRHAQGHQIQAKALTNFTLPVHLK